MARTVGTVSRGVRAPIIREGDDLEKIVVDTILNCVEEEHITLNDRDIVAVTEAVVARAQGNYASVAQIAKDVAEKYPSGDVGLIFPILSRNRFSVCLKGIASGVKKIYLMLSYPTDEVGNQLVDPDQMEEKGVNPYADVLDETRYRALFGRNVHRFTGVDYVEFYGDLIRSCGAEVEFVFANSPTAILKYTKHVLACDIHTRERSKGLLRRAGAETVYGLSLIHI